MTTDRAILELAAIAAGYQVDARASFMMWHDSRRLALRNEKGGHTLWNPEEDDGDALRLAVRLRIDLHTSPINGEPVIVTAKRRMRSDLLRQPNPTTAAESYMPDPEAATRRAITRAAAEIARAQAEGAR